MSRLSAFSGMALLLAGLILFLNTMGYLGWGVWAYLARLWPLVLVLVGLALLWHRAVLAWGLLVLFLTGLLWYTLAGGEVTVHPPRARFLSVEQDVGRNVTAINLQLGGSSRR